ncbi:MAG: DUF364 domain-containing protein [Deltaproteobacteria bacterium]|nr:DUF364 domain-containing protein [Deltaproteobacteria bacterium]
MISTGEIARRLYDAASREAEDLVVEAVRFGLSYVGVSLNNQHMGLAALLLHELPPGCSVFPEAGKIAGTRASSLLKNLVEGRNPLEKALGLATANAMMHPETAEDERDSLSIINLTPKDRVAMVGLFTPMVPKIEATGAKLSVIEKNPARMKVPGREEREKILRECTVAIITATTLLNDTLEEVLSGLGEPRHVALLGPSTPLCPEIFGGTPVSHMGGSIVRDTGKVMQIISEGGGTTAMRPYLRFINLLLPKTY